MEYTLYNYSSSYSPHDTFDGKGYKLLASINESQPWETDQSAIYAKPDGGFAFATASGCSCWDGDWQVKDFESLEAIEAEYSLADTHTSYNPTMKGFAELMAEARAALKS